jgi:Apolipoprotein N-acyltransferase
MKPLVKSVGGSFEGHGTQKERTVFESTTEVAPAICYESVYGDYTGGFIRNGAKIIFVVTNDGWWGDTPGHIQHLGFSRLRAIEHRRPVVRSANTGISCWIDPFGVVNQPTNYEEATAFTSTILTYETLTIYTRYGDIIAKIALLMSFLLV